MTALTKYDRLESGGLWREGPDARRREVVVGLRDATLVLTDPKTEMALAQWSLPAVHRVNPGKTPAIFAPADDGGEELEVDDPEMITALATVHRAVERRRPHPGRLRGVILGTTALAVVAFVVFWLPDLIKTHTSGVLPSATRIALGNMALADLARLSGSPCKSVTGRRAAEELALRLFPQDTPKIEVLRDGLTTPAHLPGNILLLPAPLIEAADNPDVVAGHLIDESIRAARHDPTSGVLDHMGLAGTLRLLTTGATLSEALAGYGETFLAAPRGPSPSPDDLLASFKTAGVSSAPFGYATRNTTGDTQMLIDADPYPLGAAIPLLSDETWLQLQAICSG